MISNIGNMYNPSTGIFTCGVTGYYQFTVHIMAAGETRMRVALRDNNNDILFIHAYDEDTFGNASNSVIMSCSAGTTLWVRCLGGDNNADIIYGGSYSNFSGVLLSII